MKSNIGIILGIVGFVAALYYAVSINKSQPYIVKNEINQSTVEQPNELPPGETAEGQFAYVNQGRLQTLASSGYKGPSYKEDYSGLERMVAERKAKQNKDRMPASAPETNHK